MSQAEGVHAIIKKPSMAMQTSEESRRKRSGQGECQYCGLRHEPRREKVQHVGEKTTLQANVDRKKDRDKLRKSSSFYNEEPNDDTDESGDALLT